MLAGGGVDADDPQAAEVALLAAAADEGVAERGVDRLFRGAIQLALVGVIALRQPKQLLALGAPDRSSFTRGISSISTVRLKPDTTLTSANLAILVPSPQSQSHLYGSIRAIFGTSTAATVVVPLRPRLRFLRLAGQDVLIERLAPQELAVLGPLEALGGAAVGLQFDLLRFFAICSCCLTAETR